MYGELRETLRFYHAGVGRDVPPGTRVKARYADLARSSDGYVVIRLDALPHFEADVHESLVLWDEEDSL